MEYRLKMLQMMEMPMAQDFKRGISPKAQKRMAEFKPANRKRSAKPDSAPNAKQLAYDGEGDLWEKAMGQRKRTRNPKVEE